MPLKSVKKVAEINSDGIFMGILRHTSTASLLPTLVSGRPGRMINVVKLAPSSLNSVNGHSPPLTNIGWRKRSNEFPNPNNLPQVGQGCRIAGGSPSLHRVDLKFSTQRDLEFRASSIRALANSIGPFMRDEVLTVSFVFAELT